MDIPDENDDPEDIVENIVGEATSLGVDSSSFSAFELTKGHVSI